ncbi:3'-5' exonuclease [Sulfurimonas aquatica]|uniref:3'-5' exonuclease n=1 Tax=Sulfurimonas aquatica TaxID=2672570 RepID=A0A975GD60_9BACT|nr:exonuclease domain-containing protein [Sulfurimonas aquatica]QSZ42396.1 3'-5' exonuclease [Sulfurimonas aquatica]
MLIFIDTETTGVESSDKICSVAIINKETKEIKYELVNEGKKIPPEASSIHHITNEMIKEKPAFIKSELFKYLQEHNTEDNTLVAHNINFDLEKLSSSGFFWKGDVIDTLKVTKHLIPECELFSLQVLRYELKLYKAEEVSKVKYGIKDALVAHNALSDALVNLLLFEYLEDICDVDKMKELSFKNVLLQKFSFGKHKGKYIEEVAQSDRAYLEWMLRSATDVDEDIKYSINHYLQG